MDENIIVVNETEEKDIVICSDCGCEIDKDCDEYYELPNGDIICNECYEDSYFTCTHCGEIEHIDNSITAEDTNDLYCESCADMELFHCEHCDNYYTRNETQQYTTAYDTVICENCCENYYSYCEECGELYHLDDLNYCEEDGYYYCNDCIEEHENEIIIKSYHNHKGCYNLHKTEKEAKKPLYFGFELEVEQGNDCSICDNNTEAVEIDNIMQGLVVFENDGSLSDGFEIISQPQTFKYIMKNKGKYKKMLQHLIDNKYISHNSSHCGLHIHLTRDYFTVNEIDKLQLLIEKFKNELCIFSRRTPEQIRHWSSFISDKHNTDTEAVDIKYIKKYKDSYNRYYALNLTNNDTIEFRLLRGTLKYNTFIASFELLNNMVKIAKNTSVKNIDTLKFEDIIKYGKNNKHLKTYCIEKNLIKKEVV